MADCWDGLSCNEPCAAVEDDDRGWDGLPLMLLVSVDGTAPGSGPTQTNSRPHRSLRMTTMPLASCTVMAPTLPVLPLFRSWRPPAGLAVRADEVSLVAVAGLHKSALVKLPLTCRSC